MREAPNEPICWNLPPTLPPLPKPFVRDKLNVASAVTASEKQCQRLSKGSFWSVYRKLIKSIVLRILIIFYYSQIHVLFSTVICTVQHVKFPSSLVIAPLKDFLLCQFKLATVPGNVVNPFSNTKQI